MSKKDSLTSNSIVKGGLAGFAASSLSLTFFSVAGSSLVAMPLGFLAGWVSTSYALKVDEKNNTKIAATLSSLGGIVLAGGVMLGANSLMNDMQSTQIDANSQHDNVYVQMVDMPEKHVDETVIYAPKPA